MTVENIEAGVLRALKAYKLEKGASAAAADTFAATKLTEGVARFKAVLAQRKREGADAEAGALAAYADLKAWAQGT